MDPASFAQLTPGHAWVYEQHPPTRALLALEYLATCGIPAAAIVLQLAGIWAITPMFIASWLVIHALCFAHGTSPIGRCASAWYEHATWCYVLPAWRVWAVVVLETAYCAASLGLGGAWSVAHRCWGGPRQSVAERLLSARLVVERRVGGRSNDVTSMCE